MTMQASIYLFDKFVNDNWFEYFSVRFLKRRPNEHQIMNIIVECVSYKKNMQALRIRYL